MIHFFIFLNFLLDFLLPFLRPPIKDSKPNCLRYFFCSSNILLNLSLLSRLGVNADLTVAKFNIGISLLIVYEFMPNIS